MAGLSPEELQRLRQFGDELGIEPAEPERILTSALAELGITSRLAVNKLRSSLRALAARR